MLAISDAVAAELYRSFDAQAGSHRVAGSTMIRRPVIARTPESKAASNSSSEGWVGR